MPTFTCEYTVWEKDQGAWTPQENLEKPLHHLLCHKYVPHKLHVNQLLVNHIYQMQG